jgi:uncharacterized protein
VAFTLGDPVRIEMEKWGHRPHWEIPGHWLGRDDHGDWIGIPAGTLMARPGFETVSEFDQVGLIPRPGGSDVERGWMATFHREPSPTWVYVDMTTPPAWEGPRVRAVDLDLDVLRMRNGWVVVDDEDEFAEHQVTLSYPPEIVALAEGSRDRVHAAILAEDAPYDGSHERWLDVLEDLTART